MLRQVVAVLRGPAYPRRNLKGQIYSWSLTREKRTASSSDSRLIRQRTNYRLSLTKQLQWRPLWIIHRSVSSQSQRAPVAPFENPRRPPNQDKTERKASESVVMLSWMQSGARIDCANTIYHFGLVIRLVRVIPGSPTEPGDTYVIGHARTTCSISAKLEIRFSVSQGVSIGFVQSRGLSSIVSSSHVLWDAEFCKIQT